jgi:ATP-binding cassette subfamily C protein LapB
MNGIIAPFLHYSRLTRLGIAYHAVTFADEEIDDEGDPLSYLTELWQRLGQETRPLPLSDLMPDQMPYMVYHPEAGWGVAEVLDGRGGLVVADGRGEQSVWDEAQRRHMQAFHLPTPEKKESRSAWAMIRASLMRHRKTLVHAAIASGLVNILTLFISIYSMQVYDKVIPTQGVSTLIVLTAGVAIASTFEFGLRWLRGHAIDRVGALVDTDVSRQLVVRLLSSRLDARPQQVGTLAAQIKGFDSVRGLMTSGTMFFAVDLPFSLLFIGVIALLGGWAVVPTLVVVALSLVLGLRASKKVHALSAKSVEDSNRKTGALVEAIESGETLKANRGEWRMLRRWNYLVEEVAITDLHLRNHNSEVTYWVTLLQSVGYVAMVATGAVLAMSGDMTTGGLMACSILNGRAVAPLMQLPSLFVQWSQTKASIKMLDRVLELPSDAAEHSEQLVPEITRGELRAEELRFGYESSPNPSVVLQQPLVIHPGERIGILGEIGSGKSTLLKLLSGLYAPQGGKIRLDGLDLAHHHPDYLRDVLGYLAQDYRLVGGTLRDNLTLGLADPGDAELLEACQATGLIHLVNSHPKGLALQISEGGRGVSGGQRQLIGLTRLLLGDAPIWLLDEPTASLDGATEAAVLRSLQQRSVGRSLIVVTHKQNLLPLFDRLLVMVSGRIALDGPRDAVLQHLQKAQAQAQAQVQLSQSAPAPCLQEAK